MNTPQQPCCSMMKVQPNKYLYNTTSGQRTYIFRAFNTWMIVVLVLCSFTRRHLWRRRRILSHSFYSLIGFYTHKSTIRCIEPPTESYELLPFLLCKINSVVFMYAMIFCVVACMSVLY